MKPLRCVNVSSGSAKTLILSLPEKLILSWHDPEQRSEPELTRC